MNSPCPFGICDGDGFVVDEETRTATPCECRAQRIAKARTRALSGVIPKHYRGASFDRPPLTEVSPPVVREVRQYISRLDDNLGNGRGLWFMGDIGTGKTTLAMMVSSAALEAGHSVAIYFLPRLLAQIRATYDDGAGNAYVELLDRLADVDLLHIDDLGAEKTSPWVLEQLYSIVNRRYEDERAIMVTTNLMPEKEEDRTNPDAIMSALGRQLTDRTVSRLVEICGDPLLLFGEDKRRVHAVPDFLLPDRRQTA